MTKDELRRLEARRKRNRVKHTKLALIAIVVVAMPLVLFLVLQR